MTEAGVLRFDGKVAIVTGAGRGLGRAYALALADRGAAVVVNDLGSGVTGSGEDAGPADVVVAEIQAAGGRAAASAASVASRPGAASIVELAIGQFGRLDIIINNAGISEHAPFETCDESVLDRHLDVHLKGSWHLGQAAWPRMKQQGQGRVVNIVSPAAWYAEPNNGPYSIAKSAVIALTRSMSIEGACHGIVVNGLAPGGLTRMAEPYVGKTAGEKAWAAAFLNLNDSAAAALWLSHERCTSSGQFFLSMGGRVARYAVMEGEGFHARAGSITPEALCKHWDTASDLANGAESGNLEEAGKFGAAFFQM